jgi:bleomycin hydrolase
MKPYTKLSLVSLIILTNFQLNAQTLKDSISDKFIFTKDIELATTPVKNQFRSGTCWSFSTVSFVESELLRKGKGTYYLSEMLFAHQAYVNKAIHYVRLQGKANFGPGGQAHDVIDVIRSFGLVPDETYPGLNIGEAEHIHGEMDEVLKAMLDAVISNKNEKLTPVWLDAFKAVADAYLGAVPGTFIYAGKSYTPASFRDMTTLNPDDYVEITSYIHHPFYSKFALELPDNWSNGEYYNLPVDEMMEVVNNSLRTGYTIVWDGDISDKGFSHKNGVAVLPDSSIDSTETSGKAKQGKLTEKQRNLKLYSFTKPVPEIKVTQVMRQKAFDNYATTDDHLMHLTGIVHDQNGTIYYLTKNSWGADGNETGGYLNMSEAYIRLNTIALMINKNAIPKSLAKKLGIQ